MEDECPICLEPLDKNIAILSCGHEYHYKCIKEWINKTKNIKKPCVICEKETEIIIIKNEIREIKKPNLFSCCNIL